jgi:hypothetical protein
MLSDDVAQHVLLCPGLLCDGQCCLTLLQGILWAVTFRWLSMQGAAI